MRACMCFVYVYFVCISPCVVVVMCLYGCECVMNFFVDVCMLAYMMLWMYRWMRSRVLV